MEALTELRHVLLTDTDPDMRASARRWAETVDAADLRDAVIQLAVYAAPHVEFRIRSQAHRQFTHVVATDNLSHAPSAPVPEGQRPNSSPRWQQRARNRDALNVLYDIRVHVPGRGFVRYRECTAEDLFGVAGSLRTQAKHLHGRADHYENVARRMIDLGAVTVEDLPPEELAS